MTTIPAALLADLLTYAIGADDLDITLEDALDGHHRAVAYREVIERAYAAGRQDAADAVLGLPVSLEDAGWAALATRAQDAGYDRAKVLSLRTRDNFSTVTVEAAYQHARLEAARVARGGAR
jgi:hypothetical protein